MIHAHWFVACAQLVVGIIWSCVMWGTGMRKVPNLTASDIAACVPIGLMACLSHAGSVLAVSSVVPVFEHNVLGPLRNVVCLAGLMLNGKSSHLSP